MSIKNAIILFLTVSITFTGVMIAVSYFKETSNNVPQDISNLIELWNSEKRLKGILDDNEYVLVDDVKIYNSEKNIDNANISNEIIQLQNDLTGLVGPIKKTELNLIIFEEMETLREYSNLKNVSAFYSNKNQAIAVVMQTTFTEEEERGELSNFLRDLRHEYTHYYLATYLKENRIKAVPTWFNEGLAEYVSSTMNSGESIYLSNEPISFLHLETKSNWKKYWENYNQSHYAIDYLIKSNGEDIVRKIINDSRELKFEESFFQNTNIEISDLHEYMN